jgi:hypothetical protein
VDAAEAIALVSDLVRSHGLDYPQEGLRAVRFEVGWRVYAPVQIDDSDPLTFLDLPIGRAVFLVGDSGRVEETSTSIPPEQGHKRFIAREIAVRRANGASDEIVGVSAPDERSSPLGAKQRSSAIEFSIAESARKNDSVGGRHTLNLGDGAPGQTTR